MSVAKEGQVSRKIDISREVADNVANARQSRSPCVGIVLLMGRGIVDYKGSNTCLDYRKGLVLDVDAWVAKRLLTSVDSKIQNVYE